MAVCVAVEKDVPVVYFCCGPMGGMNSGFSGASFAVASEAATKAASALSLMSVPEAEPDLLPVMPDMDLVTVPIWLAMHEDRRVLRRVRLLFDHLAVQLKVYVEGAPR